MSAKENFHQFQVRELKESVCVVVLNDDNPMHVPMSLRARTSALDVWLAVIKRD